MEQAVKLTQRPHKQATVTSNKLLLEY